MAKGTRLRAPSAVFYLVFLIALRDLELVVQDLLAIVPVQLADLGLAVVQVQPSLASSATTSADLADALGGNGELVNVVLGEGLALVIGSVEGAPVDGHGQYIPSLFLRVLFLVRRRKSLLVEKGILDADLTLLQTVSNMNRDPLCGVHLDGLRWLIK